MPCSDGGQYESEVRIKQQLDKVSNLLCNLCARLEKNNQSHFITTHHQLSEWWSHHQEEDRIRLIQEREEQQRLEHRKNALNKLSAAEKIALGVRD